MTKREISVGLGTGPSGDLEKDTIYLTIKTNIESANCTYSAFSKDEFNYHDYPHNKDSDLVDAGVRPLDYVIGFVTVQSTGSILDILHFVKDLEKENNAAVNYENFIRKTILFKAFIEKGEKYHQIKDYEWF